MNKKFYIQPSSAIEDWKVDEAYMLTASDEEGNVAGDGGNTSGSGVTEGDAKERNAWNEGIW